MKLKLQLLCVLKKVFTHNYCDGCGFTKEEVYTTEIFAEGGYNECKRCHEERMVDLEHITEESLRTPKGIKPNQNK
jgi:hypothetical protein